MSIESVMPSNHFILCCPLLLFPSKPIEQLMTLPHLKVIVAVVDQSLSHVTLSHATLCNPMDYSTPGFPVLHYPPGVCSNSCQLSRWCHPTISSSVAPFSSCPQFFPALGSFPMSWLFTPGGQNIGVSVSASVLPMNIQGWFSLGLTGLISLLSKGLSRVFFSTTVRKQFFSTQTSLWSNSQFHPWLLKKP